jgi:undecaprenyl pyrophosphate phosphatase UppP
MGTFTSFLALAAMAAVVLVLIRGLWNMLKGGSGNTSNKLMQARIVLQAVAVALIMLTLWITGGGR